MQNRHLPLPILLAAAMLGIAPLARAADAFLVDFERPDDIQVLDKKSGQIAEPGFNSPKCLVRDEKGIYASSTFLLGEEVKTGMKLTFDSKNETRAGQVAYTGITIRTPEGKEVWTSVPASPEWTHHEVDVLAIKPAGHAKVAVKQPLAPGDKIKSIQIFGRAKDNTADHTLYLDNVKLVTP